MPPSGGRAPHGRRAAIGEALAPWAFPALIVAANLAVLHGFWLGPKLTNQHVDLLAQWLPRWCYLGRSLAAAHVPTWLPYQSGGLPFASDPQSGWLEAPVMLLFPFMSCARALGLVIVANPLLAGLGLYVFGRNEGLGRPASAVGGLTLSLGIAATVVALSMPFAATLGWTAMALAGVAGYLMGTSAVRRLLWLGWAEFSLAQVATAHLTNGLLIAGLILALYVLLRSVAMVRAGDRPAGSAALLAIVPFVAFPVLSAAVLLPRFALLPRTSLSHGYVELAAIATRLSGTRYPPPLVRTGVSAWWGTGFARGPAGYLGAATVLLSPLAFIDRRWRLPAAGFATAAVLGWLLNLDLLIGWDALRRVATKTSLGELWLRDPYRFRYLVLLALSGLAAYGTQSWLDARAAGAGRSLARRLAWLAPGVMGFALIPLLAGSPVAPYVPLAVGLAVTVPVLTLTARGRSFAGVLLPVVVAAELTVSGFLVQGDASPRPDPRSQATRASATPPGGDRFGHLFAGLRRPDIEPSAYITPGAIGRTLVAAEADHQRYLSFDPSVARTLRGFLDHQDPGSWPAYENGRSVLFRIEEIQGLLPTQPDRYWRLVRRIDPVPILYNAATFQAAPAQVLRLFGVGWIITARGSPLPSGAEGARPAVAEGGFVLYRMPDPEPRASVVFTWRKVRGDAALDDVLRPGFDPAREAVVETDPTLGRGPLPSGTTGRATLRYDQLTPEHVRVRVTTTAPALLVVRNVFDENWTATVDGRPVPLVEADYLMQAVAVPAGAHVVDLEYRDRTIGLGLAVSGAAWGLWLVALIALSALASPRDRGWASGRR